MQIFILLPFFIVELFNNYQPLQVWILNYGRIFNLCRFLRFFFKPLQVSSQTSAGFYMQEFFSLLADSAQAAGQALIKISITCDSAQAAGQAKKNIIQQQVSNCGVKNKQ